MGWIVRRVEYHSLGERRIEKKDPKKLKIDNLVLAGPSLPEASLGAKMCMLEESIFCGLLFKAAKKFCDFCS